MTGEPCVVPLHALDTDVDVHVCGRDSAGLAAAVRHRWHLALRDADRPAPGARVVEVALVEEGSEASTPWSRQETVVRDSDERRILQWLTQSITHTVIDARAGELLMLHAAGLTHPRTGATAVFVAPGNTGKTTLCRELGPARAYLTDETVGIRRDGSLASYLKPLSTRRPDWSGVKDELAPGDAGLRAPRADPWVAGLVLLRREPGHEGPPVVEGLDTLEAVLALTPESSAFMRTTAPLRWLAEVLERTGGLRRAVYAEVADLEPLVAEVCDRRSPW